MDVVLSPRAEELVADRMSRGGYDSPSEAIEDALAALLREEEQVWDQVDWEEVNRKVAAAEEDLAAGRTVPGNAAFYERLRERVRAKSNRA